MTRIPSEYQRAEWRNTTPVDPETGLIGIGFDQPTGVIRVAVSQDSARALIDTLGEYLEVHERSHSESSSGRPTAHESIPRGSENV